MRVFGHRDVEDFDPFLMLDAFDSTDPADYARASLASPQGIETITYLISGRIDHGDSLGNRGIIGDGDCQWMTAGSGIIHQEMPKPSGTAARCTAMAQPSGEGQVVPPSTMIL